MLSFCHKWRPRALSFFVVFFHLRYSYFVFSFLAWSFILRENYQNSSWIVSKVKASLFWDYWSNVLCGVHSQVLLSSWELWRWIIVEQTFFGCWFILQNLEWSRVRFLLPCASKNKLRISAMRDWTVQIFSVVLIITGRPNLGKSSNSD